MASRFYRALAGGIIDEAVGVETTPDGTISAIKSAFNQLEQALSEVIGVQGFRAVMERAAQVSEIRMRWLDQEYAPESNPGGAGDAVSTAERERAAVIIHEAVTVLAATIGLLSNYIGEDLTLRLLGRVWPNLAGLAPIREPGKEQTP